MIVSDRKSRAESVELVCRAGFGVRCAKHQVILSDTTLNLLESISHYLH